MERKTMKVKIIRCSSPHYWYYNRIGGVFEVKSPEHYPAFGLAKKYQVVKSGDWIDEGDAVVVDREEVKVKKLFMGKPTMLANPTPERVQIICSLAEKYGVNVCSENTINHESVCTNTPAGNGGIVGAYGDEKGYYQVSFTEWVKEIVLDKPETATVRLNDKHNAVVHQRGIVEVGCQKFNIAEIMDVVKAYEGLQK